MEVAIASDVSLHPWSLSVQKEGAKQPCPLPGAAVATGKQQATHDPIFASSLRGGCIEKEQDDLGTTTVRLHQRRDERLAAEKEADHTSMNHSFTDRYVRACDGHAMKNVMAGDGMHHLEASEPETKLDSSAKPAAGQGVQVGVRGEESPHRLQLAWSGVVPNSTHSTSFSGTSLYTRQLLKEGRSRVSDNVRDVLRSEGVERAVEVDQIRQQLGRKRSVSLQSDSLDASVCGDTDERPSKNFNIVSRTTHHFTDEGISQAGSRTPPATQQKRVRNPGAFKSGYSEFTKSQHNKDDIYRYESETPQRMRRAVSVPPERFNTDVISHEQRPLAKPASASRPNTARRKSVEKNLMCAPGGVDVALRRDTAEDLARASELRTRQDAEFAKKCAETRTARAEASTFAKNTKQRLHHRGSASMSNLLRWE